MHKAKAIAQASFLGLASGLLSFYLTLGEFFLQFIPGAIFGIVLGTYFFFGIFRGSFFKFFVWILFSSLSYYAAFYIAAYISLNVTVSAVGTFSDPELLVAFPVAGFVGAALLVLGLKILTRVPTLFDAILVAVLGSILSFSFYIGSMWRPVIGVIESLVARATFSLVLPLNDATFFTLFVIWQMGMAILLVLAAQRHPQRISGQPQ